MGEIAPAPLLHPPSSAAPGELEEVDVILHQSGVPHGTVLGPSVSLLTVGEGYILHSKSYEGKDDVTPTRVHKPEQDRPSLEDTLNSY